jgi:hypothetical protein
MPVYWFVAPCGIVEFDGRFIVSCSCFYLQVNRPDDVSSKLL